MKHRICLFSPNGGSGNVSGIEVRLRKVAQHLHALGHEVHVVGPHALIEGATTHRFSLDVPLWRRPSKSLQAGRIIRKLDPTVVILEGPAILWGIGRRPVFQMIHDSKFATKHRRRGGRLLWLYYFVMCRIYSRTITVSNAERRRIASSLWLRSDKLLVSYNGIGDNWLEVPERPEKTFDLLYVSNFAPHKGHTRLIKALVGEGLSVAFVGGDLGALADAQQATADFGINASYFRNLSDADLIALYDRSRVFAFPSHLEGFGIPFLEARARGLPVVASDIEVFRELADKIGGAIVDFDDQAAVLSAIAKAMEEARAQPKTIGQFTWREIARDLMAAISRSPV